MSLLRRGAVTLSPACALAIAVASPADALSTGDVAAICTGDVRMTFTTAVTPVPLPADNTVALTTPTPLPCGGSFNGTVSINVSTMTAAPGTACAAPLAAYSLAGTIAFSDSHGIVNLAAAVLAGTTATPAWTLVAAASPLLATGGGVWTDASQIESCVWNGITIVDTQATVVIVF